MVGVLGEAPHELQLVTKVEDVADLPAPKKEKLVYLSDVNGVRRDKEDADSLIHSLSDEEARQLIADGAIDAGMIPKVEACLETIDRGVRKVHIIDGRIRHSLLLEIYTNKGVGTEIKRAE